MLKRSPVTFIVCNKQACKANDTQQPNVAEDVLCPLHAYDSSQLAASSQSQRAVVLANIRIEGLVTKRTPFILHNFHISCIISKPYDPNHHSFRALVPAQPGRFSLSLYPQNGSTTVLGGGSGPINNRLFSRISAVFLVYFSISSRSIAFSTMT